MDSQELQGWEIAKERVADFKRETDRSQLAKSLTSELSAETQVRVVVAFLFSVAGTLLWLLMR